MYDEPFDHLVFYAVLNPADEPGPDDPSLVIPPPHADVLIADNAPYLTGLSFDDMLHEIDEARLLAASEEKRQVLTDLRYWVVAQGRAGILYQLEPASIAGDSTARRIDHW